VANPARVAGPRAENEWVSDDDHTGELPGVELPSRRAIAAGIYGLVVSSSVMVAGVGYYTAPKLAVAVLVTVLVYWLAERYAELLSHSVHGHPLTLAQSAHVLREGWPLVQASYAPLATMILCYFFGLAVSTSVLIALLVSTVLLIGLGAAGGRRAGLTRFGVLVSALVAGALGLVLIGFKYLLH
jgi:hypothetical protein